MVVVSLFCFNGNLGVFIWLACVRCTAFLSEPRRWGTYVKVLPPALKIPQQIFDGGLSLDSVQTSLDLSSDFTKPSLIILCGISLCICC